MLGQRAEIGDAAPHAAAPQTSKAQQGVDQLAHLPGRFANDAQKALCFWFQPRPEIFHQDLAVAIDVAQRRAQVVGDGITEGLQLAIAHRQFGVALPEAGLRKLQFAGARRHQLIGVMQLMFEMADLIAPRRRRFGRQSRGEARAARGNLDQTPGDGMAEQQHRQDAADNADESAAPQDPI